MPEQRTWSGRPGEQDLASLPGTPAVYLLTDATGAAVQLASAQHLRRVLISRLLEGERTSRVKADLGEVVRAVRWRPVAAPFEARWWYFRLARELYPHDYRKLVSFGPAWFLHVDWTRPIPEIGVSKRVWERPGHFAGPWAGRGECQEALECLWDLFDLCRYPEQVRRAPHGTRCAYAEMGRCDAPCDGSVPLDDYVRRSRTAWEFATGGVEAWIDEAATRMRSAADERRFEHAGQIKKQIASAERWQRFWSASVRIAERLRFAIALPVTRRRAWKLFGFDAGALAEGPVLRTRELAAGIESWLRTEGLPSPDGEPGVVRMEQTWLVAHFLRSREAHGAVVAEVPLEYDVRALAASMASDIVSRAVSATRDRGDEAVG